jgi:hypothetical protein
MPLTDEERRAIKRFVVDTVMTAYVDLWGHYRALIVTASAASGLNAETLETEAEAWWREHQESLVDQGRERLAQMLGALPPPQFPV